MSDFPPRVEAFRELLQAGLPEADFLIEEIWVSRKIAYEDGYVASRSWRVTIQTGKTADGYNRIPTVVDVPDRLVLESVKTGVVLVQRSANLIVQPRRQDTTQGSRRRKDAS